MAESGPEKQTGLTGLTGSKDERDHPGIRVGVLGAGQLGQMLALAGIPLGMRFRFFSDTASAPAGVAGDVVVAAYDDVAALRSFADSVDVVTYEFENVSVTAVDVIGDVRPVWPPRTALAATQDRAAEKAVFASLGIPTARYALVDSRDGLAAAVETIGAPGILKTRRFGYDGKGQFRIRTAGDIDAAWRELGVSALIYEALVNFDRELSVIGVRAQNGESACYPVVENLHRDGILRRSLAPTTLSQDKRAQAEHFATAIMDSFGYVGVFALELFDTAAGLVANEMAPRVHNSGHWTIEGAETSQFENHLRAIAGLPLGECKPVGHSAMFNIIGELPDVVRVLKLPDAHLHLYGKAGRAGRKLGHITVRSDSPDRLCADESAMNEILRAT